MNGDRMFDLAIAPLQNGGFQLSQQGSRIDEPDIVELHPVQVRWLAERAGLLTPNPTARMTARHAWCVRALAERLDEIRRFYLDEIIDHCGSGIEFGLHLRALEDLTDEMLEDIGTAPAAEPAPECHAVSAVPAANSVTRKPGPKPSGKALTPAERQRAHRAKQAEPAAAQLELGTP